MKKNQEKTNLSFKNFYILSMPYHIIYILIILLVTIKIVQCYVAQRIIFIIAISDV